MYGVESCNEDVGAMEVGAATMGEAETVEEVRRYFVVTWDGDDKPDSGVVWQVCYADRY